MSDILLHLEERAETGKQFAKRLRREGKVPGIFYAHKEKSLPIAVDEREMMKVLTSESGLIDIKIGDKRKRKAIIKEVQSDPIKQTLYHVDIQGVRLKEKVNVSVPVQILGESKGVKDQGGILHQYLHEVEVSCLPLDIPDHVDVDVTELLVGDSVTIADLAMENVAFTQDPEQLIVSILAPTVAKEPAEEAKAEEGEEVEEKEEKEKEEA